MLIFTLYSSAEGRNEQKKNTSPWGFLGHLGVGAEETAEFAGCVLSARRGRLLRLSGGRVSMSLWYICTALFKILCCHLNKKQLSCFLIIL